MRKFAKINQIELLFLKLIENSISDDELSLLDEWFSENSSSKEHYCEFLKNYAAIQMKSDSELSKHDQVSADLDDLNDILLEMSRYEVIAPVIEIPKKEQPRELIQNLEYKKVIREKPTFSLYVAAISAAAMFLMFIFILFTPDTPAEQVATLSDMSGVVWNQSTEPLLPGTRLYTRQSPLSLRKGIIKIVYDYGAEVTVEGPAEFTIESQKELFLNEGKLSVRVLEYGKGFTVKTPSSLLVDIGTEFGVSVNSKGDSQLHVFKGGVLLSPASKKSGNTISKRYTAGQAVEVSRSDYNITEIAIRNDFAGLLSTPIAAPIVALIADSNDGPFLEIDGQVCMEAEHYFLVEARSDAPHTWIIESNTQNAVGGKYVVFPDGVFPDQVFPDDSTLLYAERGRLIYSVNFKTIGNYAVYLRVFATNSENNSTWVGLDGIMGKGNDELSRNFNTSNYNRWSWVNFGNIEVDSAGVRNFEIVRREDGFKVDRIVLTKRAAPKGTGPAESQRFE